jgi:succinate dehydrogenase / fumarate reductase cytochrome b subunit
VFGGYLLVQFLINATLLEGARHAGGPTVYQVQVDKIHSLPFLPAVEWTFIYLPILYHTVYGIWITLQGQPNVGRYPYAKNWFYTLQRASAIILVFFMAFHVLAMKGVFGGEMGRALTFAPERYATESTINHMHAAWWVGWVVYPIGILASCYHLANGFWTAAITWGLTVSKQSQRRWGYACGGLFALTLICGVVALASTLRADPRPLPGAQDEYRDPGGPSVVPTPSEAIKGAEKGVRDAAGQPKQ